MRRAVTNLHRSDHSLRTRGRIDASLDAFRGLEMDGLVSRRDPDPRIDDTHAMPVIEDLDRIQVGFGDFRTDR